MNKGEFIKAMAEKGGFTQKDANCAYDAFVETVVESLKKGDKVQLMGFGTYELRKRAARVGINPQTKKKVKISASNAPAFKAGKVFKELFN
ncbi:MAG: HU family DNA-binding protein [Clostridia bacterium]